jgi:rRNA-processing protein FCF1
MTTVALDTNALMMPVELDVRLFDELDRLLGSARRAPDTVSGEEPRTDDYDPVAPQAVAEELRKLSDTGGEEGIAASVGHDLVTDRCLLLNTEESYADDAIVELAREGTTDYVVTNDRPLRDRVLDAGVPVIGLRGKNKLAVTQP